MKTIKAQSGGIFRPWDTPGDEFKGHKKESDPVVAPITWRVPPVDWSDATTMDHWGAFAAAAAVSHGFVERSFDHIAVANKLMSANGKQRPKRFRCPHCDVAFSNNGQLKGHVRIHTGERPFKCESEGCGKSFTRNEELTRHKRIHSGVRPYPCQECGKTFGRKDHLKKHARTHLPQYQVELPPHLFLYPYLYGY